jgi:predicted O-methyltransferase YrrM
MHFISQELEDYIEQHSKRTSIISRYKENQKILLPRMLSGHFQGRVLSMLAKLIRPMNILEIGTYAIPHYAFEGMQENGYTHHRY